MINKEGRIPAKFRTVCLKTVLSVVLLFSITIVSYAGNTVNQAPTEADAGKGFSTQQDISQNPTSIQPYDKYIENFRNSERIEAVVELTADDIVNKENADLVDGSKYNTDGTVIYTKDEGFVEFKADIPATGLYNIAAYYVLAENGTAVAERELYIDGKIPFFEAQSIILQRIWENDVKTMKQNGGKTSFLTDNRDNHIVPTQKSVQLWSEQYLIDITGYAQEPFLFFFTRGEHLIRLVGLREDAIIKTVTLKQKPVQLSYDNVHINYKNKPAYTGDIIKIQGEDAVLKSDPVLYPVTDRSSPVTEPSHPTKIRLNTIGGTNWSIPGQWIEWEIDVPQDGQYAIAFKARQNLISGMFSTRRLYIDNKVPFYEANLIEVNYAGNWQFVVTGENGGPFEYYLTKGKHTLRLEVVIGRSGDLFKKAKESVLVLNETYRKIIMLTSTTPDPLRNYHIKKVMPDVIETFKQQTKKIEEISAELEKISGKKGSSHTVLDNLAYQLELFVNKPMTITQRLESFRGNVSALGSWVLDMSKQPLEIDYICLLPPDYKNLKIELPEPNAGFFSKFSYELKAFLGSFFQDYSLIGDTSSNDRPTIDVWINTGRDQASIIKRQIVMNFSPKKNIDVNLKIAGVGGGLSTLLLATASGNGPDIAMSIGGGEPVNYAARGAAVDVSKFDDFNEVIKRFKPEAMVPLEYNGGYYALPETQSFYMMFYRKDILNELKLELPKTWQELYAVIGELQKKHMTVGIPGGEAGADLMFLGTLIYQKNGTVYSSDKKRCVLDRPEAISSFEDWANLYSNYNLPLDYNGANRFRTGEMPILIADYTFYNSLDILAPEIKGLWDFDTIPGYQSEEGTINNLSVSGGACIMMLQKTKNADASWEYMKWWTDTKTQTDYGRELESLLGPAARHPSANVEAVKNLSWKAADLKKLLVQWDKTKAIPEVPGGYYVGRYIENALRLSLSYNRDPREVLREYVETINDEISFKRKEFGLDERGGKNG